MLGGQQAGLQPYGSLGQYGSGMQNPQGSGQLGSLPPGALGQQLAGGGGSGYGGMGPAPGGLQGMPNGVGAGPPQPPPPAMQGMSTSAPNGNAPDQGTRSIFPCPDVHAWFVCCNLTYRLDRLRAAFFPRSSSSSLHFCVVRRV
jgi:hypothetical protein